MLNKTEKMTMHRVPYGKASTPLEQREYYLGMGCPVGTAAEIKEAYKDSKYSEIWLLGLDFKLDQVIKY